MLKYEKNTKSTKDTVEFRSNHSRIDKFFFFTYRKLAQIKVNLKWNKKKSTLC